MWASLSPLFRPLVPAGKWTTRSQEGGRSPRICCEGHTGRLKGGYCFGSPWNNHHTRRHHPQRRRAPSSPAAEGRWAPFCPGRKGPPPGAAPPSRREAGLSQTVASKGHPPGSRWSGLPYLVTGRQVLRVKMRDPCSSSPLSPAIGFGLAERRPEQARARPQLLNTGQCQRQDAQPCEPSPVSTSCLSRSLFFTYFSE